MDYKTYLHRFSRGAKNVLHTVKQNIDANTQLKQQQVKLMQQAQQHAYFANVLTDIQAELFQVFGYKNYPQMQTLMLHTDIMPSGYQEKNGSFLFTYQMLANNQPAAHIIYAQLKQKLNNDLYAYQQQLLCYMPFDQSMLLYPYLLHGLYVMNVSQNGIFITITVASNYLP